MQNGPYIAHRLLPGIIQDICARRGIDYHAFSDDWVLRLQKAERVRWVVGYKFDANLSAAGQLAQDKVATYMALTAEGIPAVEHYLVRSVPHDPNEMHYSLNGLKDGPVVIKPLDGTGGRAVECYESIAEALAAVHKSAEPAWAIAQFYDVDTEYRLVMLGDTVLLAHAKTQPTLRGRLKLFNLGYGAVATDVEDEELMNQLTSMAQKAMRAMSLNVASVDIVHTSDGDLRILEVNDGIALEHYMQQSDEYKNRAATVYDAVVAAMFA